MTDEAVCCGLKVGQSVPNFEMKTFDSADGKFGSISLDALKKAGKWTIVFFYPADFTFV
jgi:peroxiredoxin (alkyl hydroperoxide reductase subunit C)